MTQEDPKNQGTQADPPDLPVVVGQDVTGDQQQITMVRDFFVQLAKSFKTIALHRHAKHMYEKYLQPAYLVLADLLDLFENVTLIVDQQAFKYRGQPVYQEDVSEHNLAFKFYREGVRLLILRRGLTSRELLDFTMICLAQAATAGTPQEDLISLLWKRDFEHIDYVKVESYSLSEDASEEETNLERVQLL